MTAPNRSARITGSCRTCRRALLPLAMLAAPALAHAIDCDIACRKPRACSFWKGDTAVNVVDGRYTRTSDCQLLMAKGPAVVRYRHKGAWFTPPQIASASGEVRLADTFNTYRADPCSVPSFKCTQQVMNGMSGDIGGSPIDGRKSQPGGQGEPCALGFPCGRVLPPPASWTFRLADDSVTGTWVVRVARGTPPPGESAQTTARVDRGVVTADGNWFRPGRFCTYDVLDASGRVVATGEFAVASRATHADITALATRGTAKGLPDAIAWVDTLVANRLDWDAAQATLHAATPGERP